MRCFVRLAAVEMVSLLRPRRWLLVVLTATVVALLASGDVAGLAVNLGLVPGALDVHAAATNNLMYLGYLFLTSFALLVTDSVIADRCGGLARLHLCRGVSSRRWWFAKACAVAPLALASNVLLLVCCTAVGVLWRGWPLDLAPSPLGIGGGLSSFGSLFPSVAASGSMLARQMLVVCYAGFAFWSGIVLLMALTLRSARPSLPAACVLFVLMVDYVAAKAWEPWSGVAVGAHLLEGALGPSPVAGVASLLDGFAYFAALAAGGMIAGAWLANRSDF